MTSSGPRALRAAAAVLLAGALGVGALSGTAVTAAASPGDDVYAAPPGSPAATPEGTTPDGSFERPFATIPDALAHAGPGVTVHLRGGVYDHGGPSPEVSAGGAAGAPLTVRAYEDEQPVMTDGCLDVFADHVVVQGLECDGDSGPGIMVKASHVEILDNVVHDVAGAGIPVYTDSLAEFTDVLIQGNTVYDTARSNIARDADGGWPFAIGALGADDIRILDNVSFQNYGEGINCAGVEDCVIADNTIYDNFSVNLYVDNSIDTRVYRNFSYSTGDTEYFRDDRPAAGIQFANENAAGQPWEERRLRGVTVQNNIVSGAGDCLHYGGYEAGGGMKDFRIAHNTFHDCTLGGLFIGADDGHENSLVTGNIFTQSGDRPLVRIEEDADLSGLRFTRNLWVGGDPGRAAGRSDVNADPQLLDPASLTPEGFRIADDSPARDATFALARVAEDFFGTKRDARPDLGAHEVTG